MDKTPINKVVALSLDYKVSFDQNLSSVQNSSEKSSGKSAKTEILTESVGQFVNSNFRSIFIKIRAVLYQTPNRKVETLASLYQFRVHNFLRTIHFHGDYGR